MTVAPMDLHGHAKGEHKPFGTERPLAYTPRMLFLWFCQAASRGISAMVTDHANLLTAGDAFAVETVRDALAMAAEGDAAGAAQLAGVTASQAQVAGSALRDGLTFAVGIEADNDPRIPGGAPAIVERLRPDRIVRSVHFIDVDGWMWPFDNPEFSGAFERVGVETAWERYAQRLFADLVALPSDIVAHFYVPSKFGHWPCDRRLDGYEDRLIEICAARDIAIEFNTRLLYRSTSASFIEAYLRVHRRLLEKAKRAGVRIALGSDAHQPNDQGRGLDVALELVTGCGARDLLVEAPRRAEVVS